MKKQHDQKLQKANLKERNLVLWYPRKIDGKQKNLTMVWTRPYKIVKIHKNGFIQLKDLKGMELPQRVNRGKLRKYQPRSQDCEAQNEEKEGDRLEEEPLNKIEPPISSNPPLPQQ